MQGQLPGSCSLQIKLFLVPTLLTVLNLFQVQQPAKGTCEGGRKEPNTNTDAVCTRACSAGTKFTLALDCTNSDRAELLNPLVMSAQKWRLQSQFLLVM